MVKLRGPDAWPSSLLFVSCGRRRRVEHPVIQQFQKSPDGFGIFEDSGVRLLEAFHFGGLGLCARVELARQGDRAVAGRRRAIRAPLAPAEEELKGQIRR